MSASNNENNPHIAMLQVGTQAASISLPGLKFPKHSKVKKVSLINQAALAADDTNYLQVQLCNLADDSVLAEVSSKLTGGEGALVANKPLADSQAAWDAAAGLEVYVKVIKNGTGVPTLAQLQIEYFPY
jgi:hypothetical protein